MEKIKSVLKGEHHSSSSPSTHETSATTGTAGASTTGSGYDNTTSSSSTTVPSTTESYETRDAVTAPAVEKETVKRLQEEQVQEVRDVERHQDHYHTTVQPLQDRQVDPTVHKERVAETQYGEFEHDDANKTKAALEAQAAQFQNTRTDLGTTKTTSDLGTVGNESVHHHMHETVQPVIEREVVQPSVVHTTIPVKEVHHEAAHIHGTDVAAPMSVNEFEKTQGATQGSTTGSNVTQ